MLSERALKRGTDVPHGDLASLHHWYPVSLDADARVLWWRHLGERRFAEPFFQDSLAAQPPHERQVCRTPLAALHSLPAGVPPTAFIFHVSRCGSTLLTQMLATSPRCIVMSEPPVLDAFFRLHHSQPGRSGGLETLRGLVSALGQRRHPGEAHLFIKFDSWHVPWMPLVREAFPGTPILFLYREPDEVLASHRRQRGPQMVPGLVDTSRLDPRADGLAPGDLDGYTQRMLDAVFMGALDALPSTGARLLNYRQLPEVVWETLLPGWGVACSPAELALLKARSAYHSKHGAAAFAGDADADAGKSKKMDRQAMAVQVYARLEAERQLREGKMPSTAMM